MSLIDWSDPEEMLGLLVEYVADEKTISHGDAARVAFLTELLEDLERLADAQLETTDQIARALAEIRRSQPREFVADPVMDHLDACIAELERIDVLR